MDKVLEQFARKVVVTDTCWLWEASLFATGYGYFQNQKAHRVAYELFKGSIPEGLVIDHLCRVKTCVNPNHLEAVTNHTNILRAWNQQPCPHGADARRRCKSCLAEKARRYRSQGKRIA